MDTNIFLQINRLLQFGIKKELICVEDEIYVRNKILEILNIEDFEDVKAPEEELESCVSILEEILDWAYVNKVLEFNSPVFRDLLDTKIMDAFINRPSVVIKDFYSRYEVAPSLATKYFYDMSINSNYIRTDRVKKNMIWKSETEYGDLDITINLSKPEKDPNAIAAAKNIKSTSYPLCLLCKENEGYAGRIDHPARQNHRIIPLELTEESWFLQYSPYVYYNEHSIIFKGEHEPMKISKVTFDRLLEFVEKFPHYFIGSNADLPIVGGSILSHDHFQGGNYEFAMAKAPIIKKINLDNYADIEVGLVKWPMSVIRLTGIDREKISQLGDEILNKWKNYSDEEVGIHAFSCDTPHNTITPIARKRGENYELDLVLRNNRTDEDYPLGIFHPHNEVHHIKKENIGLIEVMGLAVLPARLKEELIGVADVLVKSMPVNDEELLKHEDWIKELSENYSDITSENVHDILKKEVGKKFMKCLVHAGVFKCNEKGFEAFEKFVNTLNH